MKQVSKTIDSLVLSSPLYCLISLHRTILNYRSMLLFAGIVMLIGGCKKDDQFCKKTVPFKAEFETTLEVIKEGKPGGILEVDHLIGKGEGTPIGKATFDANVESDIYAPEPQLVTGKQTLTAENGDKIFSTVKGYAIGPDANGDIKVINSNIITGGTGKYAGATGSFTANATANIESPTGHALYEGSITY